MANCRNCIKRKACMNKATLKECNYKNSFKSFISIEKYQEQLNSYLGGLSQTFTVTSSTGTFSNSLYYTYTGRIGGN